MAPSRAPAFLPVDLAPQPRGGLYQSLYKRLRGFILDGIWPPGTRLPSSRTLAGDLKVSRNTAILAIEQLIADGWVESRSRSGVYVAAASAARPTTIGSQAHSPSDLPPFAPNRPASDLFPAQIWKQLQARAWAQIEAPELGSPDSAGHPELREAIARLVCAPRGLGCHPDQILVVPTASAAIDLIAATLVCPGDGVLIPDPARPSIRHLFAAHGAKLHVVPLDRVRNTAPLSDARLAWVSSSSQFPTGAPLTPLSRDLLLDWLYARGAWLIEDDRDAELWSGEPPPEPLAATNGQRVVLVGSFNRVLFPGLCVAFLVAPIGLIERLHAAHALAGGRASLTSQLALAAFINEGHFARHLRRRREAYAKRRELLVRLLSDLIDPFAVNRAGMHLVIEMDAEGARAVEARLAAERLGGVAIERLAPQSGRAQLVLGLGASPETIGDEARRLASAIQSALAEEVR